MLSPTPALEGDALAAVEHRGSNVQIIAGAGSGKTEVVSQRVAALLAERVAPDAIVGFTFTEKAAAELKARIAARVEARLGRQALDRLNSLYVGTIHGYCFQLLQQRVRKYETYDVLDDNQLAAFLAREARRLELKQFDGRSRTFASIDAFARTVDVVENEMLPLGMLPDPFRSVAVSYYETLERYRLLTYGLQVSRAVEELEAGLAAEVHQTLRHLIVDEYQDINNAQDRLIRALAGTQVEVCVVGDDQQAIYQWRGSDVSRIMEFAKDPHFTPVATFEITTNRRSRPQLVGAANEFSKSIKPRIPKTMNPFREDVDGVDLVAWAAETEAEEVGYITELILRLVDDDGVAPRDIAVLVRSGTAYRAIVEQFDTSGIPVAPIGRTGLFTQPEAIALGKVFCWLADWDWRAQYSPVSEKVTGKAVVADLAVAFGLNPAARSAVAKALRDWKDVVPKDRRSANLVGEFYELLAALAVRDWDFDSPADVNRLGVLARFTALLADYESVRRRARPDGAVAGEQVGGQDRGEWYYKNLAIHIINYAQGNYEGFDGEQDFTLNAVDLLTVHRAKGLEWPAVFLPSLTVGRFPSKWVDDEAEYLIPRKLFDAARYDTHDVDERRLFYVGMTRARDWLSVSRHKKVTKNRSTPSPYFLELDDHLVDGEEVAIPPIEGRAGGADDHVEITFSEIAAFLDCGLAFRLRNLFGFQPRLAPELGYGKAVHHLMRSVAEETRASGVVPSATRIDELLDEQFFLPTANKVQHKNLKDAARRLVGQYTRKHADDLYRVWETERPFELHLDGVTVNGRADVILDQEGGVPTGLAIVDYKTSTSGEVEQHALQLQVYAEAGRREGLDIRGAYVHDLRAEDRQTIPLGATDRAGAAATIEEAASRIRARDYSPSPGPNCRGCEVRTICPHAKY